MRLAAISLVAVSFASGGCASLFTDSGRSWKVASGPPTCSAKTGFVIDAVMATAGLVAAFAAASTCDEGDELDDGVCSGLRAAPGIAVVIAGTGGMIVGGIKMSTCGNAHRRWDAARAGVVDELEHRTGTDIMTLGDTLVLVAPTAEVCNANDWFIQVRAQRARLAERGLVRVSCRVGDQEVAGGRLDL